MGVGFGFDEDVLGAHFSGFARFYARFGFSKVFLGECVIGLEGGQRFESAGWRFHVGPIRGTHCPLLLYASAKLGL